MQAKYTILHSAKNVSATFSVYVNYKPFILTELYHATASSDYPYHVNSRVTRITTNSHIFSSFFGKIILHHLLTNSIYFFTT